MSRDNCVVPDNMGIWDNENMEQLPDSREFLIIFDVPCGCTSLKCATFDLRYIFIGKNPQLTGESRILVSDIFYYTKCMAGKGIGK